MSCLQGDGSSDTQINSGQHPGMALTSHVINDTVVAIYLTPSTDGDPSWRLNVTDPVSEVEASSSTDVTTSSATAPTPSTLLTVSTGTLSPSLPSTASSDSKPIELALPLGLGLGLGLGVPLVCIGIWYYVHRCKKDKKVERAELQ